MVSPTQNWRLQKHTIIMLFLLCISFSSLVEAITSSKKLDQPPDTEIKCGSCPCGYTCGEQSPPPPSPSPPPLPPPSPPPPSSPPPPPPSPPPPKVLSCPQNCNPLPPPPPRFIYVPVPGNANPAKPYTWIYYYSAAENRDVGLLVLTGLGAFSITMIFG